MSPLDPSLDPFPEMAKVRTYPISSRKSLVTHRNFCDVPDPIVGFGTFFDSLPDIYAGTHLKDLVARIVAAKTNGKPVAVALGAHVLKVGLAPLLIDWMRRGIIDHIAMNGAGAIHDFEIATAGCTSEDVGEQLPRGEFGFVDETAQGLARAVERGCTPNTDERPGFGSGLGALLLEMDAPYNHLSVSAEAARLDIPCTVHVSLGADIVHMHPATDGAKIGEASLIDFRHVCRFVHEMNGGVWINVGCAVVLPETFLKAVSVAINLGADLGEITTANLDMLRQYRAETNVVSRPPGRGISILGQHEILLPLLRMAVLTQLEQKGWKAADSAS
ncbi:MAG: hypothetical protein ACI8X5_003646 [Planctomycetota bacterium]|jgi:hypothetical protein